MKVIRLITKIGAYGACVSLVILMVVSVSNAIGRYFFNAPLRGTLEINSYMLVLIVALGLGAAAIETKHIKVDLLMARLSKRAQFYIDAAMLSLTVITLALTTWSVVRVAITTATRYTIVLHIPDTPFIWIFGIGGWGLCCLGALVVLIQLLRKRGKDEP